MLLDSHGFRVLLDNHGRWYMGYMRVYENMGVCEGIRGICGKRGYICRFHSLLLVVLEKSQRRWTLKPSGWW